MTNTKLPSDVVGTMANCSLHSTTPKTVNGEAAPWMENCCHRCGETDFSPNIEAFEICGKLTCDECAEGVFEENSQFGMGA